MEKGEIQVAEQERNQQNENLFKEIVSMVADKCVNPETKRPYTFSIIEKTLREIHFNCTPKRSAKQQALDAIRQIQERGVLPIARAHMKVRIVVANSAEVKRFRERLRPMLAVIETEDYSPEYEMVALIDPGQYRPIDELLTAEKRALAKLEVLNVKESPVGDDRE